MKVLARAKTMPQLQLRSKQDRVKAESNVSRPGLSCISQSFPKSLTSILGARRLVQLVNLVATHPDTLSDELLLEMYTDYPEVRQHMASVPKIKKRLFLTPSQSEIERDTCRYLVTLKEDEDYYLYLESELLSSDEVATCSINQEVLNGTTPNKLFVQDTKYMERACTINLTRASLERLGLRSVTKKLPRTDIQTLPGTSKSAGPPSQVPHLCASQGHLERDLCSQTPMAYACNRCGTYYKRRMENG